MYAGVQTRGAVTDYAAIKADGAGFGVVALKGRTPTLYMKDTNVQYDGTSSEWKYSPAIYWPNNGETLGFYAFAPYNAAGINKGTGSADFENTISPSVTLTLQTPKKMVDLVVAKAEGKTSADGTVSLQFNHVSSRVALKAHTSAAVTSGTEVKITELKILGSTTNNSSLFYNIAKYDIKSGDWTLTDSGKSGDDWTILTSGTSDETYDAATITDTSASILNDEYLFLIPVGTTEMADAIKMSLTYTITSNGITTTNTKPVSITTGSSKFLQKGTAYVTDFEIGLNTINFIIDENTGVGGWDTEGGATVS